ncbi:MAG: signal peptide peptidase SppA [Prevotellaceae bacterium]|jgi:protease-4|nr:signal peptide peptidase SppA [Prevotellaceae bacterium]
MKSFFKMLLAFILGIIIMTTVFIVIIVSALQQTSEPIPENSILKISFNKPLEDRSGIPSINITGLKVENNMGLNSLLFAIERAKFDPRIKGVYLELSNISAGMASVEEIRNALSDFRKESGKYVLAYAETYSQKAYFLATIADKIYLNPFGNVMFTGMSSEIVFYKGLLEKLGVEVQIVRHGKFKSAVEPFMLDKISDENREQITEYMGSIWNYVLQTIESSREIDINELKKTADNIELTSAETALEKKFVDKLLYEDEVYAELQRYSGSKLNLIDINRYFAPLNSDGSENRIAIIYASGEIMTGEGDTDIMSKSIMKAIDKARRDSSVKAVVLRVNSPGGSADAAEFIARELEITKIYKPVVISMGNLAASGGYWISAPGNVIFAHHTTITGSIGVFGMIPNIEKAAKDKLGITFDAVTTNKHSGFPSITRPLKPAELDYLQKSVEFIYSKFIGKVSEFRKMSVSKTDSIGQGRVWSGVNAMELGLIDYFGGLKEAIEEAARLAEITDYTLVELPKELSTFEFLMKSIEMSATKNRFDGFAKYCEPLINSLKNYGILAKLPYETIETD